METTRHFTATMFIVHEGATAIHWHDRLELWLPPGGHVERDELPHHAALRETKEETGLDADLLQTAEGPRSATARPLPKPAHQLIEDINVTAEGVGHQHIDSIYYGTVDSRDIAPHDADERDPDHWRWVTPAELQTDEAVDADVATMGIEAVQASESPAHSE